MNKPSKIIALGELLIDFVAIDSGVTVGESSGFEKKPGGAPGNVAVGLSRLGTPSGLIANVGNDEFGNFLKKTMEENSVDASHIYSTDDANTTLAFVSLKANGERSFCFYRKPGADTFLSPANISEEYIKSASLFHFGSLSLTDEPARSATYKAIDIAQRNNLIISYDPNLRLNLWGNETTARAEILAALPFADIVKISDDERDFLTGKEDNLEAAKEIASYGPSLVCISLGDKGSFAYFKGQGIFVPGFKVKAIDTTGAGDAFVAGLLFNIINQVNTKEALKEVKSLNLEEILRFANAAGALCTTKKGAIPAMPTVEQVKSVINEQ